MVDVSADILAKAKVRLEELTNTWHGGVCNGECWTLEGGLAAKGHVYCHSWVSDGFRLQCHVGGTFDFSMSKYPDNAKSFLVLTCHSPKNTHATTEATRAIIHWMAKESPFSQYVLNRDDDESLEYGAIILCGPDGASQAEAMWMCKVLRYSKEGSKSLDTWKTLVDAGVNPMLAVLVATYVSSVNGAQFGFAKVQGHVTVFHYHGHTGDPNLVRLMKGDAVKFAKDTSSLYMDKDGNTGVEKKIKSFCAPVVKPDGWGGEVKGKGADKQLFIERVLEWQKEIETTDKSLVEKVVAAAKKMPDKNSVFLELDM